MRKRHLFFLLCVAGLAAVPGESSGDELVAVSQGWSAKDKEAWYTTTQGSRLMPLSWIRALEQPDSQKPFLSSEFITSLRYLPGAAPSDLPIGFAIDKRDDSDLSTTKLRWMKNQPPNEPWVGLTCSACHSNEITYHGKRLRVEGGPTLADFQTFREALDKALNQTLRDDEKFERFASKVSGEDQENKDLLRAEMGKLVDWELGLAKANATSLRYGFGRLDAIANIFNKVATIVKAPAQLYHSADAPVSYPVLWNISQLSKVQWDASVPNGPVVEGIDLGALGRNTGEVIGVFGDVQIEPWLLSWSRPGYVSSVDVPNLIKLEELLQRLEPPAWPSVFPPIDQAKRQTGQKLFAQQCSKCHTHLDRSDLTTHVDVENTLLKGEGRIGTDPWMACNAYADASRTGLMIASPKGYFAIPPLQRITLLAETAPVLDMLSTAVVGSIVNALPRAKHFLTETFAKGLFDRKPHVHPLDLQPLDLNNLIPEIDPSTVPADKIAQLKQCLSDDSPVLGYKFRPLTGVWATPPYLHNGSAPTLYDVLLPPDQRPKTFYVGTREYDPVKVGFKTDKSTDNTFEFRVNDASGTPIQGNLNSGHDYGNAQLSDADREALIEYMKGL